MARMKIGGVREVHPKKDTITKLEPDSISGLFGKQAVTKLKPAERAYNKVVQAKEDGCFDNLGPSDISLYFSQRFYQLYKKSCVDYNIHNARSTMEKLVTFCDGDTEKAISLVDTAIDDFSYYQQKLRLWDSVPTVSMFKRTWILEELMRGPNRHGGMYE